MKANDWFTHFHISDVVDIQILTKDHHQSLCVHVKKKTLKHYEGLAFAIIKK